MNTTQLKYALEIEKTRSITAAAQNLYLSQPNLSKAIKELERETNMTIFVRSTKGVIPTREGKEFLKNARVIYEQIENFDAKYCAKSSDAVEMTICIPRATYLSLALAEYLNRITNVSRISVSIKECNPMFTIKSIASGEAQIGVLRYYSKHEKYLFEVLEKYGIEYIPLLEFEPVILMSKNHPLAEKDDILPEELEEYIEIIPGDDEEMRRENSFADIGVYSGVQTKKIYLYGRGSQGDIISNVQGTYMWVSNMPQNVLDAANLTLKKCTKQNRVARDILVHRKGRIFSIYENMLCECINKKIDEMYG